MLPDWLQKLLLPSAEPGIAASLVQVFFVMAMGILLGKLRIGKISLGIAGVLFAGILIGHLGYRLDEHIMDFIRDAGLILFVYAVGMQVGPSFFSSFQKNGLLYNGLAAATVLLGALVTILLWNLTGNGMDNMVGIMSGAVTNTPGLGAAKAALKDISAKNPELVFTDPANAYAITYPFGVLGLIAMMVLGRVLFRVNLKKEMISFEEGLRAQYPNPISVKCRVTKPDYVGKTIDEFLEDTGQAVVVSRLKHSGSTIVESPVGTTVLKERDVLMLVGLPGDIDNAVERIGHVSTDRFIESDAVTKARTLLVTQSGAAHKSIAQLDLDDQFGVQITRVYRAGLELLARPSLVLHYGDRIRVVGTEQCLDRVTKLVGNSEKKLQEPQLLSIFLGIVLGVLLGSVPIMLPGLSAPVKLGMAAGPLLVALLISRYGGISSIHSFLNQSAILFMKDFGICLFFAAVGIHAGESFYNTFVTYNGWAWIGYGMIVTIVPLLIMLLVARLVFRLNYMPLLGLMSGTYTDPAALAFSTSYFKTDLATQAYATVYPLVTILRILVAQLLVLYFTR
jgi:putative transport protein